MSSLENNSEWDVIVIGGGAAGFFGAISIAEHSQNQPKIVILEKSAQLLGKVKISGGGRCNVTHDCLEPKELTKNYPRGLKTLIGPFHHFGPTDTINWFEGRGVDLKVEDDGRMFPTTDSSQTVINCLTAAVDEYGISVFTKSGVSSIAKTEGGFELTVNDEQVIKTKRVLLATGGTRLQAGAKLAIDLGHDLQEAVPSLFTFSIDHPLLEDLEGLSVNPAEVQIGDTKYKNRGPLLITHWGVSGPGILKLSALAARDLAEVDYTFDLKVNWSPDLDVDRHLQHKRQEWGKKQISTRSPLASIPKRLWSRFCELAEIPEGMTWAQLTKAQQKALIQLIQKTILPVTGKSMNKDEFVTCGGVTLKEVSFKTMESKVCSGLHFAGEVLDIDGVTGGFNFQNAWTTGYLAGKAIAAVL